MSVLVAQRGVCSACPTASTGGTCQYCGSHWYRGDDGKMYAARVEFVATAEPTTAFWRNSATLRESLDYAESIDLRLAEAVDALNTLWNILVLQELSDQQGGVMLVVHTHGPLTSREVAEAIGVSHQAASNVLNTLVAKRLLTRQRVGRTHRYRVAILWPMGRVVKAAQLAVRRRPGSSVTGEETPPR